MQNLPIVMDNGTSTLKVGYAWEELPRVVSPAVVGRPKYVGLFSQSHTNPFYIGQDALNMRGVCTLKYPMYCGPVADPDTLLMLWDYAIQTRLGSDPREHSILVTEPTLATAVNREIMATVLFECMNVPAIHIASQSVLALYASGKVTGLVVDCGESASCITPVYDSFLLKEATLRYPIAGRMITECLKQLLTEVDCRLYTSAEHEIAREIKEHMCFVATDFRKENTRNAYSNREFYRLPDGRLLNLTNQTFRAPELLFRYNEFGFDLPGLPEMVRMALAKCPYDVRRELMNNIILSGGTTMFRGFARRLRRELRVCGLQTVPLKIKASHSPLNQAWVGGSILASLHGARTMWITREQYHEHGVRILHER